MKASRLPLPSKMPCEQDRLTEEQEFYNKQIILVRNRVESVFARYDAFKVMHHSHYHLQFNTEAFYLITLCLQTEDLLTRRSDQGIELTYWLTT